MVHANVFETDVWGDHHMRRMSSEHRAINC